MSQKQIDKKLGVHGYYVFPYLDYIKTLNIQEFKVKKNLTYINTLLISIQVN